MGVSLLPLRYLLVFFLFWLFVVFLYLECENWFKIVVCHSACSQQQFWVCGVHWCMRRGARTAPITIGQVHRKRREVKIYTRPCSRTPASPAVTLFYLWTGEKPVSTNASRKSDDVHFLSMSWLRQPCSAVSYATFLVTVAQTVTCSFSPGFLLQKSQIMQDQSLCAFHLAYL